MEIRLLDPSEDAQHSIIYLRGLIHSLPGDNYGERCLRKLVFDLNGLASPSELGELAGTKDNLAAVSADLHKVQVELDEAHEELRQRTMQVDLILDALAPLVSLACALRGEEDYYCAGIKKDDEKDQYIQVSAGELRNLLRAAGLFTDEMLPRPNTPAAAEQAGTDDAPPAQPGNHELVAEGATLQAPTTEPVAPDEPGEAAEFAQDRQGVDPF